MWSRRRCCESTARSKRGERIESPRAFVATVTTRLAIDELRSARVAPRAVRGRWLPEPILTDGRDDPARQAEMADSLSLAMLVLLESLSPEQRAVLLLRDVFDYGYDEIAADRRQERGQRAPARQPGPAARRAAPAALSDLARAARRARAAVLRRGAGGGPGRPRGAARARRRADRRRRRQGPGAGPPAARPQPRGAGAASTGSGWAPASRAPRSGRSRSTGRRARCCSTARIGWSGLGARDRRRPDRRLEARSSIRTSSGTSGRWRMSGLF